MISYWLFKSEDQVLRKIFTFKVMHTKSTRILCRSTISVQQSQQKHNLATRGPQSAPMAQATTSNGHNLTVFSLMGLKFVGDIQKGGHFENF